MRDTIRKSANRYGRRGKPKFHSCQQQRRYVVTHGTLNIATRRVENGRRQGMGRGPVQCAAVRRRGPNPRHVPLVLHGLDAPGKLPRGEIMNTWCVPFALAKITGQTSDQIASRIKAGEFGEHHSKFVRRVRTSLWVAALPVLGVRVTAHVRRPGMTVATWAGIRARHGDATPWIVHVCGHVLLYRAGRFYDNCTDPKGAAPDTYKYRNSRVESARQVTAWSDANPFREPGVYLGPKTPWAKPRRRPLARLSLPSESRRTRSVSRTRGPSWRVGNPRLRGRLLQCANCSAACGPSNGLPKV